MWSVVTETRVVSEMRRMKSTMASSRPISMAMVRSKMTVRKKVESSTATSLRGFFNSDRKVRHSLML